MKKNNNFDFMNWLHETREKMENERKKSGISIKQWSEKITNNLKKKGIEIEKQKEVTKI